MARAAAEPSLPEADPPISLQRLEIMALAGGLVSTFSTATGYFWGYAEAERGPVMSFFILCVWLLVFGFMVGIDAGRKLWVRKEPDKDERFLGAKAYRRAFRLQVSLLTIAVLATLWVWGIGVVRHAQVPPQVEVNGYVYLSEKPMGEGPGATPTGLPQVTIQANYGGKALPLHYSDETGFFRLRVDVAYQHRLLYLSYEKPGFSPQVRSLNVFSGPVLTTTVFLPLTE